MNSGDLVIGVGGSGTLNIRDTGSVSSASGIIGILGSGEVVVRDGTWTSSSQIQIGASSSGTLDISGTGTVTSVSNVIGGRDGSTGELSISDSGTMFGGSGVIGFESGATGSVRISDQATLANSETFTVGVGGSGILEIVNSGKLSNATGVIGLNAGSGGTVVIADNGSWTNSEILFVGVEGSGELDISGSAEVSSFEGSLGRAVGGTGIARISGGTWSNQERLRVGRNGTGLLEISGTGHVISPVVEVAFNESATGTVLLNGGMLSVEQMTEEEGTGGGSVRFNGGTLQLMADQPDLFANFEAGDVTFGTGGGIIDTQAFDVATSLSLQGSGGLTKTGTGNLLLSGASTYTGSTDIRQGNFFVNGSLDATDTFVRDTARLGGGGRLGGDLTVERGGFLSPGNSTGILTVGGNLMLGSGSITQMEINGTVPGTQHDQIIVGGTATVDGVLELYFGGGLANGDSFTLIETNNPIAGEFDSIVNVLGNALTFETALTDGAILTITATQSDFTPFALTSNQQAVAQAIDDESLTGKVNDVVNVLNTLPGSSLPGAFDEIAPASLAFIPSTAFANSRFQLRNLSNHMRQRRDSIRPKTATSPEVRKQMVSFGGAQPGSDESRWGLFTSGNFDRIDGDSNGSGYDSEAFGPTVGVDYQLTECFLLGFHTGYDNADLEFGNNAGDVQGDSVTFGLYGTWFHEGGSWVEGTLGGGYHSYDTTRSVLGAEATGDTSSSEFLVSLASGYDYRFGTRNEWLFTPSLGLAYNRLATDGFTESGSVAPLAFRDQTAESLNGNLDLRLKYEREWNGIQWQPYGNIGWRHEFLERSQAIGARFATGTQIFTVNGPRSPRDSVTFGAGINAILNDSLGVGLDYRGEANSSFRVHQVGASLKFEF